MEKNTVFEGGMGDLGLGIEGVLRWPSMTAKGRMMPFVFRC